MAQLKGKIALVTGAARGIGAAIATGFAEEGALVCVADLSHDQAQAAAKYLGAGAFGAVVDVPDPALIGKMVDEVITRVGRIDILVNNAGVFGAQTWFEIAAESAYVTGQTVNVEMQEIAGKNSDMRAAR